MCSAAVSACVIMSFMRCRAAVQECVGVFCASPVE